MRLNGIAVKRVALVLTAVVLVFLSAVQIYYIVTESIERRDVGGAGIIDIIAKASSAVVDLQAEDNHQKLEQRPSEKFPQEVKEPPLPLAIHVEGIDDESGSDTPEPLPPTRFDRQESDDSNVERERNWFRSRMPRSPGTHRSRDAVMIISVNSGAITMARNMLCSLLRSEAWEALDGIVFWALDSNVADQLVDLREDIIDGSFFQDDSAGKKLHARQLFGVYFDPKLIGTPNFVTGFEDFGTYMWMMSLRLEFFNRLLTKVEINYAFADIDMYFHADPIKDLNLPFGVPGLTSLPAINHETVEDMYRDVPDLVYSTDARKPYHLLEDPYEGEPRTPKICGGFFFVRSNERTRALFQALKDQNFNDQWGMQMLLNNGDFDVVLVDPLPAGIKQRKPWIASLTAGGGDAGAESQEVAAPSQDIFHRTLRVRILSQAAYANAMPEYAPVGTRGPGWHRYVRELEARGEREVVYHPNYWRPMGGFTDQDKDRGHWVWNDNKTWIFESVNMWKLTSELKCILRN